MLSQSKIEVWYKVSGDGVLLGETCSSKERDVISLWVDLPFDLGSSENQGYQLSLFDDGGRHIADKPVSQSHAEQLLGQDDTVNICQAINQFCFAVDGRRVSSSNSNDQADLAFI